MLNGEWGRAGTDERRTQNAERRTQNDEVRKRSVPAIVSDSHGVIPMSRAGVGIALHIAQALTWIACSSE